MRKIITLLLLVSFFNVDAQRRRTTAMFDADTTTRPPAGTYGIGVISNTPYLVPFSGVNIAFGMRPWITANFANIIHSHSLSSASINGFMSSAQWTKLDGIATNANNYVHPTSDGNLHVPATGTGNNGKFLKAGATEGSLSWSLLTKSDVGLGSVDNTADNAKNVLSATKLTTARTINGVSFNGTANITVADATKIALTAVKQVTGTSTTDLMSQKAITDTFATKEPTFSKNTGFNKNFGTTAGTVSEGNHVHSNYVTTNTNQTTGLTGNKTWGGIHAFGVATIDGISIHGGGTSTSLFVTSGTKNITNTGNFNTAVGSHSLYSNTTGQYNTAIGYHTLYSNIAGNYNTATGFYSLRLNTTGSSNTATGYQSLYSNTTGNSNTALGFYSLTSNTTGANNTALGFYSLTSNTTGANNTALGNGSLYSNVSGIGNVAIGNRAGYYETGSNAFYVGNVQQANTTNDKKYSLLYGQFSGAAGSLTGQQLTVNGKLNVDSGTNTGDGLYVKGKINTTSIAINSIVKIDASGNLAAATGSDFPTLTGYATELWTTDNFAAKVHTHAISGVTGLQAALDGKTTESWVTAKNYITAASLPTNYVTTNTNQTTGLTGNKTWSGEHSFADATIDGISIHSGSSTSLFVTSGTKNTTNTGNNNTALGYENLGKNTTGQDNTGVGYRSLYYNTTGSNNTGISYRTLYFNTIGNRNTGVGDFSLYSNTTGGDNTATGFHSLISNTTGNYNTALGYTSGGFTSDDYPNETGSNSVFLGANTKPLSDSQTNQIVIGYDATGIGSNTAIIGNSSITKTELKGNVGIGTSSPSEKLHVVGSIRQTGVTNSTLKADADGKIVADTRTWTDGTVTSVGLTVPTGFTTGSNVTTTGNLALNFDTGYSLPTTSKQSDWDAKLGVGANISLLTNNAGYITSASLPTDYVNTTGDQAAIAGNKEWHGQHVWYNTPSDDFTAISASRIIISSDQSGDWMKGYFLGGSNAAPFGAGFGATGNGTTIGYYYAGFSSTNAYNIRINSSTDPTVGTNTIWHAGNLRSNAQNDSRYLQSSLVKQVTGTSTTDLMSQKAITDAIALKANTASPTFTGTVGGITKAMVGLGNVDNTADNVKNVLSATKLTTAVNINGVSFNGTTNITIYDDTKEPTFSKNTGFNKNFGTTSGTLAEGNDSRIVANTAKVSSQWVNNGANIYYSSGNVGIGNSNPSRKLVVNGDIGFDYGDGGAYSGIRQTGTALSFFSVVSVNPNTLTYKFLNHSDAAIVSISNGGALLVGTTTLNGYKLQVDSGTDTGSGLYVRGATVSNSYGVSAVQTAPGTSSTACVAGEVRFAADYIYVCTATNTWKRSALSTF